MTTHLDAYTTGNFASMAKALEELPLLMAEFRAKHDLGIGAASVEAEVPFIVWRGIEDTSLTAEVSEVIRIFKMMSTYKEHN